MGTMLCLPTVGYMRILKHSSRLTTSRNMQCVPVSIKVKYLVFKLAFSKCKN